MFLVSTEIALSLFLVTATFTKHFGKYGKIIDHVIMKDKYTSQPRGFGFITYADPSVVDKVIEDSHIINGKQVNVICKLRILFLTFFSLIYSLWCFAIDKLVVWWKTCFASFKIPC